MFLDVMQAFHKVLHVELNAKLKSMVPRQYSEIIKFYLADGYFRVKQKNAYSEIKETKAGVPNTVCLGRVSTFCT